MTDVASSFGGFGDANKTGPDYAYDQNGNPPQDRNKDIYICYSLLNLPEKVTAG